MGLTGIRANAYTAAEVGDEVIEPHDETSQAAAGHEELYVVLSGSARFTVAGETLRRADRDARPRRRRRAPRGDRAGTGDDDRRLQRRARLRPPPAAFEYWYAAEPHYISGDYDTGITILDEGLEYHSDSPGLNYQLACYHALAGRSREAIKHLKIALEGTDGRVVEWAREDEDLDSIRADPDFPKLD